MLLLLRTLELITLTTLMDSGFRQNDNEFAIRIPLQFYLLN